MFTGELAESRQTEIAIRDIDEYAMELLIEYCYTSRVVVDEKNVQVLLPAACILQVRSLNIISKIGCPTLWHVCLLYSFFLVFEKKSFS